MDICIIIPAFNPGEELIAYVEELISNGIDKILLINDGSDSKCEMIFKTLSSEKEITLFTHAVNMGKGRALKDAFNYYLVHLADRSGGVITVDSDGQHTVRDVLRVRKEMRRYPDALILGVRDFNDASVPPKSKLGNKLTRVTLKLLVGGSVSDTQTGLRGIPNALLGKWSVLSGERFEYETSMLIDAIRSGVKICETTIQTVYINDNRETHFNPITDSIAIYRLILGTFFKYTLSSLVSFLVDYGVFCLFVAVLDFLKDVEKIWFSTIAARVCSSLFNYAVNKNMVFKGDGDKKAIVNYYILCVCQMTCSAVFVSLLNDLNFIPIRLGKIAVDLCLFLVSFHFQRRWVFKKEMQTK